MKAIVLREVGGPQNLHLEEIETPAAGAGEILIKVHRAAFNRRDVFITQGLYPGIVFPVIPGSDGCGEELFLGLAAEVIRDNSVGEY